MGLFALLSIVLGLAFVAIGGTATFSTFGIGTITFPALVYSTVITKYALLVGGILLLIDSFSVRSFHTMMPSIGTIVLGAILAFLGAFPLLLDHNLLSWLPFAIKFDIPDLVLTGLLTVFGFFLVAFGFKAFRSAAMFGR